MILQEGEDENDMDGNEPTENNTLIIDEESEHTMLLGRGVNQQQYKGNNFPQATFPHPVYPSVLIYRFNGSCFNYWLGLFAFFFLV